MKHASVRAMVGYDANGSRVADDFYETPQQATHALCDNETFNGGIWEPACGADAICKVLKKRGYSDITASDKTDRGYGEGGMDFVVGALAGISEADLNRFRRPNIITNPPFSLSCEFTERALELATGKVAIFNKLTFLAGKNRYRKLYSQGRLRRVYVFPTRPPFKSGTSGKEMSGLMEFAWFVFDGDAAGPPPVIKWIE